MKKLFILIAAFVVSSQSFAFDPVNEKLIESFKTSFPHAENVAWQELSNAFVVSFLEDNIRARAFFDKEGTLTQLIRYYAESHLPFAVLHDVKKLYKDKKIYGVVEVTATGANRNMTTEYYVKLEDKSHWITVKMNGHGNTTVTQRLRKA